MPVFKIFIFFKPTFEVKPINGLAYKKERVVTLQITKNIYNFPHYRSIQKTALK